MKTTIFIEKAIPDRDGKCQLVFRIPIDKKILRLPIGIKVYPEAWKQDSQSVWYNKKAIEPLWKSYNEKIQILKDRLRKIEHNADQTLTKEYVKSKYDSFDQNTYVKENQTNYLQLFTDFYREYENKRAWGYLKRFLTNKVKLEEYIEKRKLTGLGYNDIDKNFYEDFQDFLIETNVANSTQYSYFKIFKRIYAYAISKGIELPYDPNSLETIEYNHLPDPALTWDEVKLIENTEMPFSYLAKAKDLFLFRCYCGCRWSEMQTINKSRYNEKSNTLKLQLKKQKKFNEILLAEPALKILQKYDFKLPLISVQKENNYIKKVVKLAEITRQYEEVRYSGSKPKERRGPIHEFISSHSARRTFASHMANDLNMPIQDLCKYIGHSNISTTYKYLQIDPKKSESFIKLL